MANLNVNDDLGMDLLQTSDSRFDLSSYVALPHFIVHTAEDRVVGILQLPRMEDSQACLARDRRCECIGERFV